MYACFQHKSHHYENDDLYVVTPTNGKYIDQKTDKEVYKDAFRIENDEMKHQMIERVLDKYKRSISKDTEQNLEDIPIHDGKDYFFIIDQKLTQLKEFI